MKEMTIILIFVIMSTISALVAAVVAADTAEVLKNLMRTEVILCDLTDSKKTTK